MAKKETVGRVNRTMIKKARRLNALTLAICVAALIAGIAGGIGAYKYICRDDAFLINGKKNYRAEAGEEISYRDEGARVVSFGRDISDRVQVKTNMVKNADGSYAVGPDEGSYYIIYTVDSVKFGKLQRVRTITVGGNG